MTSPPSSSSRSVVQPRRLGTADARLPRLWHAELDAARRPSGLVLRAMQVGQHVLALLLTVIGTARALATGAQLAPVLAIAAAVLVWYVIGVRPGSRWQSGQRARWWVIGLALTWVVAVGVSAEFSWLAFLLWLLAGHLLPGRVAIGFSVTVFLVVAAAPYVHHGVTTYADIIGPAVGGLFALGISRGYLELLREAQEREQLLASLTQAQAEAADLQDELALTQRHAGALAERARLAPDIHDTVAQGLSSIRLIAHATSDGTADPVAARGLAQVEDLAGESLRDVRRIIAALAPAELEDGALVAALGRMLDRLSEHTGIATELHVDDTLPALPATAEVALLRTAQSALANVRRHAAADRVVVSLVDDTDTVRLDIIDDGRGFDLADWSARTPEPDSGYGLRFMRARLSDLGGGLEVESVPGDGTAVSAHVPIRSHG